MYKMACVLSSKKGLRPFASHAYLVPIRTAVILDINECVASSERTCTDLLFTFDGTEFKVWLVPNKNTRSREPRLIFFGTCYTKGVDSEQLGRQVLNQMFDNDYDIEYTEIKDAVL